MAEPYGVVSTGFSRKTLPEILADIETRMVAVFGAGVVQDSQSPLGQINALFADLVGEIWELAGEVYQSFDPDQVDGARLDMIGDIRALTRGTGTDDATFRKQITNAGDASIKANAALEALRALDGVTWASVIENSTHAFDFAGVPPHSLAFSVIGGDDDEVAAAIYRNTVSGIGLYGHTAVTTAVDGYCRQILFTRPTDVLITVELDIHPLDQTGDCGGASASEIIESVVASAYGDWINGKSITPGHLQAYVGEIGGLELVEGRIARTGAEPARQTIDMAFDERPVLIPQNVVVRFV